MKGVVHRVSRIEQMIGWIFKQGMRASGVIDRLDQLDRKIESLDNKIDGRSAGLMTEIERSRIELSARMDRSRAELATELRAEMAEQGKALRKEMADLNTGLRTEIASLEKGTAVLSVRFDEAVKLRERLATLEEKVARGSAH
jgi:chromosome segregation ATPase